MHSASSVELPGMWVHAHNVVPSEGSTMSTHNPQVDVPQDPRCKLATVRVKRVRCPKCKGVRLHRYRSTRDQGDGTGLAYVECLNPRCRERFKLIQE